MGVDGDNADRNKRAMLKHFRNLVDETASKATFLAAFKRTGSNKEDTLDRVSSMKGKTSSEAPDSSNAAGSESDEACSMEDDSREPSGNAGLDGDEDCQMLGIKSEADCSGESPSHGL